MSTAHHRSAGMEFPLSPRSNPSRSADHATKTSTTRAHQGTTQNASSYSKSKQKLPSTRTSSDPPSHHQDDARKHGDYFRDGGSSKKARRPTSQTGFLSMGAWCEPRPARDQALVVDGHAHGADTVARTPPATPYIGRLQTPPLSPFMTYDTEFEPRRHEAQREDSINESWCLVRKPKMEMQLDAAKAYIAQRKSGNH